MDEPLDFPSTNIQLRGEPPAERGPWEVIKMGNGFSVECWGGPGGGLIHIFENNSATHGRSHVASRPRAIAAVVELNRKDGRETPWSVLSENAQRVALMLKAFHPHPRALTLFQRDELVAYLGDDIQCVPNGAAGFDARLTPAGADLLRRSFKAWLNE